MRYECPNCLGLDGYHSGVDVCPTNPQKQCTKCKVIQDLTQFRRSDKGGYRGDCHACHNKYQKERYNKDIEASRNKARAYRSQPEVKVRRAKLQRKWTRVNPKISMLIRIKKRAREEGLDYNLTVEDIQIPEYCPALGIKLEIRSDGLWGPWDHSPSLDRIDSSKGYVKGNVVVISYRANRIKSNGSWEELEKISRWLKRLIQ